MKHIEPELRLLLQVALDRALEINDRRIIPKLRIMLNEVDTASASAYWTKDGHLADVRVQRPHKQARCDHTLRLRVNPKNGWNWICCKCGYKSQRKCPLEFWQIHLTTC